MAYYDENGRITIDESAAQADIKRIETAIASLNNSKKAINNLIQQATSEQGQTSTAVIEKATEMRNQIDAMIARLSETASFISRTVAHYQWVDQKIKEAINASHSVASSAATTASQPVTMQKHNNSDILSGLGKTAKSFLDELKKNGGKK